MSKNLGREDVEGIFDGYANDRERIKMNSIRFRNKNLIDAFKSVYGDEVGSFSKSKVKEFNNIVVLEAGMIYEGKVTSIGARGVTFAVDGVKDEIVCKETFTDCLSEVQNYLLNHDNKLLFEVRSIERGKATVSVLNAYYRKWVEEINTCIKKEDGIRVHIDKLVNGGYVAHTTITPLYELTKKPYTSAVFIPGSHIVLNIERDFERWVGEDVVIVPQKFGDFKQNGKPMEKSLVGSRKRVLQIVGMNNLYELYNNYQLTQSPNYKGNGLEIDGTVTGIINSAKRTGIFVEINDKFITGLMPMTKDDLLDWKPGDPIKVRIKEFECIPNAEPFFFNKKGTKVIKANVRPVFEIA